MVYAVLVVVVVASGGGGGSGWRGEKRLERNRLPLCDKINLAIKLVFDGRKTTFQAETVRAKKRQKMSGLNRS